MIKFCDNIEAADRDAILTHGKCFLKKMEILEADKISRYLYENDIDINIQIHQVLELKYIISKMNGDLDPSVNGDFMLD